MAAGVTWEIGDIVSVLEGSGKPRWSMTRKILCEMLWKNIATSIASRQFLKSANYMTCRPIGRQKIIRLQGMWMLRLLRGL
jgi:hypothetical protein